MHPAIAQQAKVKIGLLLPYTGTYAALGHNITDAMKLGFAEAGNKLGGREFELIQLDSEADPAKAAANTNKLIVGAKVDFLSGPVHSGVAMAMAKIAREEGTISVVSNAGANAVHARNVWIEHFPNLIQQLAGLLSDGDRDGATRAQACRFDDLELRGRQGNDRRVPGRL